MIPVYRYVEEGDYMYFPSDRGNPHSNGPAPDDVNSRPYPVYRVVDAPDEWEPQGEGKVLYEPIDPNNVPSVDSDNIAWNPDNFPGEELMFATEPKELLPWEYSKADDRRVQIDTRDNLYPDNGPCTARKHIVPHRVDAKVGLESAGEHESTYDRILQILRDEFDLIGEVEIRSP